MVRLCCQPTAPLCLLRVVVGGHGTLWAHLERVTRLLPRHPGRLLPLACREVLMEAAALATPGQIGLMGAVAVALLEMAWARQPRGGPLL